MLSVIIPTYKPGEYLNKCVESVAAQSLSYDNFEVIIILNGEKEPYYSHIQEMIRRYPNFILIYTSSKGVSHARNIGLDKATGEYITFIDDDDIVSFNYLRGLLSIAEKDKFGLSYIHSFKRSPDFVTDNYFLALKFKNVEQYINQPLFKARSFLSCIAGKIISRNVIGARRFNTHLENGEDSLFLASLTDQLRGISFTDSDIIYFVRERENSASRRKFQKSQLCILWFRLVYEYCKLYFLNPLSYSFKFFFIRILSVSKGVFHLSKN